MSDLVFQGRDEFCREQVADKVIQLLTSDIHISPMLIDGDWGTGKTEFCHKLINKFKTSNENYQLLYVDAFQADHADNALMTILSAVMTLLPEADDKKTLLEKALPVVRYSLATTAKAVVSHVLKQNADDIADGLDEHLQDAADKAIDASVKALLKDHEKAHENLKALQNTLESIAKKTPIVIFVDELDRCRPDFAIQVLEVIKHIFNVDQVQFVLVTNTIQLKAAINHCYGPLVDSQRYLDKFLKFSFRLPDFVPGKLKRGGEFTLAAAEHFSNLLQQSAMLQDSGLIEQNGVYDFAVSLIEKNRLSLREVETFVRHLEIYHSLSQGLNNDIIFGCQLLRIFGIFSFCFSPDVAQSIQKNNPDAAQVTALMGLASQPDYELNYYGCSHTDVIALMLAQESAVNGEKYQLPADQQHRFKEIKAGYFSRGWGKEPDEIYAPVRESIMCLQLGSR